MLSIIIPSYKDPLLIRTIDSLLENAAGEIEIIAILDGYWPTFELRQDPRVRYIHLGKNRGMRRAINAGVAIAKGEYLMRTDEHCSFGKRYDVILTKDIYDFVVKNKFIKYTDRWNNPRTVQIDFSYPTPEAISQESLF